jgi:hypothetical protein
VVTFERRVGRLVEIRDDGNRPASGLPPFGRVIALADELGRDAQVIVCADMRLGKVMPQEIADKVALAVRTSLTRVERGVTLLPADGIAARQFARIFGEGHGDDRGPMLHTSDEAIAALDPLLHAAERVRLRAFLG